MSDKPDVAALAAMIEFAVTDWDGSQEVDGAEPVHIPNCGQLRAIASELTRLAAERDSLKAAFRSVDEERTFWKNNCAGAVKERDAANAEIARLREALEGERDRCIRIVHEQRCERGTDWDLACTTIAAALKPDTGEGP